MNDNVFDRMIGYKEVKRELLLILDRLQNPQKYQQLGVTPPHNLLLFGAPGVGKPRSLPAGRQGGNGAVLRRDGYRDD